MPQLDIYLVSEMTISTLIVLYYTIHYNTINLFIPLLMQISIPFIKKKIKERKSIKTIKTTKKVQKKKIIKIKTYIVQKYIKKKIIKIF